MFLRTPADFVGLSSQSILNPVQGIHIRLFKRIPKCYQFFLKPISNEAPKSGCLTQTRLLVTGEDEKECSESISYKFDRIVVPA